MEESEKCLYLPQVLKLTQSIKEQKMQQTLTNLWLQVPNRLRCCNEWQHTVTNPESQQTPKW